MSPELKVKREELKAISKGFQMLVKQGAMENVNQGLAQYYAEQGHTTLHSYRQWQELGFQVKKGAKALLMWGKPQPIKGKEQPQAQTQPTEKKGGDEKDDSDFFPLAYVFSNLQVEKK